MVGIEDLKWGDGVGKKSSFGIEMKSDCTMGTKGYHEQPLGTMGSMEYKGYNNKFVVLIVSEKPGGTKGNYGRIFRTLSKYT